MNVTMNRVNGVYERDLELTMVIVANNQNVIFLEDTVINPDPYSNNNGGVMLGQNQTTYDTNIVFTSQYNYFISISEAELKLNNTAFYAISLQSPIAKLLLGKTEDDTIRFRSSTFAIVKVM